MYQWRVTIERWPYSGMDQKEAGPREETFTVNGWNIYEAGRYAKLYQQGVETDQHVWQAPIMKIEKLR